MAKKAAAKQKRTVMTVGPNGPMARHGWKITLAGSVPGTLTSTTRTWRGVQTGGLLDVFVTEYFKTKAKAVRTAVRLCRGQARKGALLELKIKDRTGTIRDGRTYGKDPRKIKG